LSGDRVLLQTTQIGSREAGRAAHGLTTLRGNCRRVRLRSIGGKARSRRRRAEVRDTRRMHSDSEVLGCHFPVKNVADFFANGTATTLRVSPGWVTPSVQRRIAPSLPGAL
jgi:hypothetical protein